MVATEAITRLRSVLPTGQTLPVEAWERRHRWMLASLWLQMAGIAVYSFLRGYGPGHVALHMLPMLATTLAASDGRLSRRLRSVASAFAMLTGAAIAVHISGGLIEGHFYFFVVIVVLSLYEDWLPFLLAIGYVVLHHGLVGTIDPSGVYAAGSPGVGDPWGTAVVHGAFIAAAGTAAVIGWRLNEDVREAANRSQEQFRRSFEEAPIGMALCDSSGRVVAANRSLCAILAYPRNELTGRHFRDLTHPGDGEPGRGPLEALGGGERSEASLEKRYLNRDGETVWASVHVSKLVEPGGEDRFIVQMQDVTARKRADEEAAIRSSQQQALLTLGRVALSSERLDNLFHKAIELVAGNLETDQVRVIEYMESAGGPRPHLAADLAGGPEPGEVALTAAERAAASAGEVVALDREAAATIRDQGGRTFGVLSATGAGEAFGSQDLGFVEAVAHVLSGAVQRHRSEEELRYQSLHDPLLGLPNRVLFLDRVQRALQRLRRHQGSAAVVFIDLDRFKLINDSLGHEAGDQLLQAVVPRLKGVLRENDTLARFGGDEFVVLCEELDDSTQGMFLAGRLHQAFKEPFAIGDQEHSISASLGVAVATGGRGRAEELIRDADAAMYRAKTAGGNRIELFDEVLRARILHRLEIETGLRRAISERQLALHYQPIVDLSGREISRSEALIRWEHPERGLIPPDQFIPVAEDTGLILPLGAWVIDEACRQMREWSRTGPPELAQLSVAINLSALQVAQKGIVELIGEALDRHGVKPGRLICEITETALIHNPESAAQTLLDLDALGVGVALDDFGTGYSSLASLKQFRLSAIKLDRTFIKDLTPSSRDAKILGSLVSMAESLGLGVVAEGVETPAQCRQLEEMGCQVAQGFLFGHPVAPDAFRDYFTGVGDEAAGA